MTHGFERLASAYVNQCTDADLAVALASAPDPVVGGAELRYTIDVSNAGPSVATSTQLTLSLPIDAHVIASTPAGVCAVSGTTLTCQLGNLAVSGTQQIVVTVTAPLTSTTIDATATGASTRRDPNRTNNSASVTDRILAPTSTPTVTATADSTITSTPSTPGDRNRARPVPARDRARRPQHARQRQRQRSR